MRMILGCLAAVATLTSLGAASAAEDSDGVEAVRVPYLDLRAGWSQPPGLTIEENVTTTGQLPAGYSWNSEDHRGQRGSLGVVWGQDRTRGFLAGAGLSYTRWETTPTSYTGGPTVPTTYTYSNQSILDAKLLMLDLQVGYAVGMHLNESLTTWIELAPTLGVGAMTASSEAQIAVGMFRKATGTNLALEYGLRGGWYLAERNWLFGLTGAWAYTRADVDIEFSQYTSSTLRVEGKGFRLGAEVGYRF